jgi:FlaA1/EpsC-like NDP-sugar epimerase
VLIQKIPNWFLSWPRSVKRAVAVVVDALLCILALWVTLSIRVEQLVLPSQMPWLPVAVSVGLAIPLFVQFGLYRAIFRYAGLNAFAAMAKAMALYSLAFAALFMAFGVEGVPRSIGISQPLLLFLFVGFSRFAVRYWLGGLYKERASNQDAARMLIYGAGSAGRQLAGAIGASKEMQLLGYVDDDDRLHGQVLNGLRIYGFKDIRRLRDTQKVSLVLLAIPSAPRAKRNEILRQLGQLHLQVRTLPPLQDLAQGRVRLSDLKELDLDDLLGREPVPPNPLLMAKRTTGKTVMVTGAGGSIGSELCRQILQSQPRKLLLVELNEFALYTIHQELASALLAQPTGQSKAQVEIIPLLGNVRDATRMNEIMGTWRPETLYHAAAYKHVPLVEHNPAEGVRNNVFGTLTLAQQALRNGVQDFVLISTDKAVRPTNIMGASKRLAEMVLQAHTASTQTPTAQTRFSMVRFGNVLGSSGSVVPLFRQQIKNGGPITLTHEDVTRYFMTIPEAAQLVIQAGAMAKGGEVHVLDMGPPVKISDLARRMLTLAGLTVKEASNPNGDIEIQTIGLRPGEKLYEELLIGDNPQPTQHPSIMKAQEEFLPWPQLQPRLRAFDAALDANDINTIKQLLAELVTGFQPQAAAPLPPAETQNLVAA